MVLEGFSEVQIFFWVVLALLGGFLLCPVIYYIVAFGVNHLASQRSKKEGR